MVKTMKNKNLTINKRLQARKRAESRLKAYGIISISIALIMLSTLMISIGLNGYSALQQAYVKLDINVESKNVLDENGEFSNKKALLFNWDGIVSKSFISILSLIRSILLANFNALHILAVNLNADMCSGTS